MSELIARQRGRLRSIILWLLWQSPKRGVEIIDDIYKMTWGWWRPSPGSVYPLLNKMVEEGVIERTEDNKYKITQKGVDEIKEFLPIRSSGSLEDYVKELEGLLEYFKEIDKDRLIPYRERILNTLKGLERVVSNA